MNIPAGHEAFLRLAVIAAGAAHLAIGLGSLPIPRILRWSDELARVSPLIRQIFWVYAAYILVCNLSFGAVSILASDALLNGSTLAVCVTGFITLWWLARLGIEWFYFDYGDSPMPASPMYKFLHRALVTAFLLIALAYGAAFAANLMNR